MKLVIGLLSCAQHQDRDDLCRRTWIPKATVLGIDVVFLRGGGSGKTIRNGDILLLPTPTSYESLPQRTRAFCQWLLTTDATAAFKADNDTYLVPERLLAFEHWDADYFGNEPGGRFRGWASGGGGYGLSKTAIQIVAERMTGRHGAEDKMVSKTLSAHDIKPFFAEPRRFVAWGIDAPDRRPTADNAIISTHQISFDLWMKIHQEIYG